MSEQVRLFRKAETAFSDYGDGLGSAEIARLIGPDSSTTMGAYLGRFNGRSVPWTVHYDELIVCIEGIFRLRNGVETYKLQPGDVLWIKEGTELHYEGDDALVFMAIAPVDWRSRQSQTCIV